MARPPSLQSSLGKLVDQFRYRSPTPFSGRLLLRLAFLAFLAFEVRQQVLEVADREVGFVGLIWGAEGS